MTSSEFSCPLGPMAGVPALCTFTLTGVNADTTSGLVAGDATGVRGVVGRAKADRDGSWIAAGRATCTTDGVLRVRFGAETVTAPAPCRGLLSGDGAATGPLRAVAGDPVLCTPPIRGMAVATLGQCLLAAAGVGAAPGATGSADATAGVALRSHTTTNTRGVWTLTQDALAPLGITTRSSDGAIDVSFGAETVRVPVDCGGPLPPI